jgi:hypothetical protein
VHVVLSSVYVRPAVQQQVLAIIYAIGTSLESASPAWCATGVSSGCGVLSVIPTYRNSNKSNNKSTALSDMCVLC